jgi:predicted phosphodiesterase
MIYAIISDIHANLEALEVCLNEIDKIKPDRLICLGDLVDYCAQPNEVTSIIKQRCDVVILGNHDEAQFDFSVSDSFSANAHISSVYTRKVLKKEYIEYFKELLYSHSENDLLFVHASPHLPERYRYVLDAESAKINFESFDEKVCFIGHSHVPIIFELDEGNIAEKELIKLDGSCRYIINVGSVGQPRDGNPKLSFGVFDSEKLEYKLIRLDYNIKSASDKILNEGLPDFLAMRLFGGV